MSVREIAAIAREPRSTGRSCSRPRLSHDGFDRVREGRPQAVALERGEPGGRDAARRGDLARAARPRHHAARASSAAEPRHRADRKPSGLRGRRGPAPRPRPSSASTTSAMKAGPQPEIAVAASIRRSSTGTSSPSRPKRSSRSCSVRSVERRAGDVAEGPAANLRGDVGHEAQHRRARAERLLERRDVGRSQDRDHRAGRARRPATRMSSATGPSAAGFIASTSTSAARRARGWSRPAGRPLARRARVRARRPASLTSTRPGPASASRPAARERAGHVARTDQPDDQGRLLGRGAGTQLWLKKPFSSSRARSSADTSTLRGVSRNTLSAIRCMPPSSA